MTTELRREFHDQLAVLHSRVGEMGRVVVDGVRDATAALLDGDTALADRVIAADGFIDETYPWVEAEVFDVVARQGPVARDLRFVIATFRIAANIERCGDLVSSIARRAQRFDRAALRPAVRSRLDALGREVSAMFERSMQAYAVLDLDAALAVSQLDDRVDGLHRDLLHELVTEPVDVESSIDLAMIARFYERVGDHAVVIAERVRFVVSGEMDAGDRDEA